MTVKNEKSIIDAVYKKKDDYYSSSAYSYFHQQGEAVVHAVDQKYRPREQTTRSGFYLGLHTGLYESLNETFTSIYSEADPLFIFNSKHKGQEDVALRAQKFLNASWESMGQGNLGGTLQWLAITRDVPLYSMGVAYVRWHREGANAVTPTNVKTAFGDQLEWTDQLRTVLDEPEIERIHPFNWFGQWDVSNPGYEGIIRRWSLKDLHDAAQDPSFNKQGLEKLEEMIKKGGQGDDKDYHKEDENEFRQRERQIDILEYFGPLNDVKGMEDDSNEYHIICNQKVLLKMEVNKMPGYRPIKRTYSSQRNDTPFGRNMLSPSLPHTKIMNLMTNLGIDDVMGRMHHGWAVWEQFLENPNDFANPEGTNGIVYMAPGSNKNHLPARIGGERSGVFDDLTNMVNMINTDKERTSATDQSLGLQGDANETATGRLLLKNADSKRTRSAIITMADTGLKPIGQHVNLLALKNTPQVVRQQMSYDGEPFNMSNDDVVWVWNNNTFNISDSILKDQENEALKRTNFLTVARDVLLQDPAGLPKLQNIIRDVGRQSGIKNIERYFPEDTPIQVSQQPQPANPSTLSPTAGGAPLPQGPVPLPTGVEPQPLGAPNVGEVIDGFAFKGGDPSLPTSWEAV